MKSQISIARELITDQLRVHEDCFNRHREERNEMALNLDRVAIQVTKDCLRCLEDAVQLSRQEVLF